MFRLLGLLLTTICLQAAGYKAGIARVIITPKKPMYLSGYSSREHLSEGTLQDLWAKALALDDGKGSRVVIVTTDLIGLPRGISDVVAARVLKEYGIDRARLVLNSSHTHSGPILRGNLMNQRELTPADLLAIDEYSGELTQNLVALVGAALREMQPVSLSLGHGLGTFAMNRRTNSKRGTVSPAIRKGPTDHDVPVLKVATPDGRLLAVLFGYACHNTTITGEFYQFSGDYAGFAQAAIEKANPGASAMFLMLCGADQNPNPRSTLALAGQYGAMLAGEVQRVLGGSLQPVRGRLRAAFQIVELQFAIHTRATFEARLNDKLPARVRHAKTMLKTYDDGHPIRGYPYPVQALSFGKDLHIIALGGEVVVDYVLRAKKQYGAEKLIVAGYSNDVMSYIPSLRVLKEGGYEASDSMIYYGQPGPYNEDVEETIFRTIGQVMKRVNQ